MDVIDSRTQADGTTVRRRRRCPLCLARFTTYERPALRNQAEVREEVGQLRAVLLDAVLRLEALRRRVLPEQPEREGDR